MKLPKIKKQCPWSSVCHVIEHDVSMKSQWWLPNMICLVGTVVYVCVCVFWLFFAKHSPQTARVTSWTSSPTNKLNPVHQSLFHFENLLPPENHLWNEPFFLFFGLGNWNRGNQHTGGYILTFRRQVKWKAAILVDGDSILPSAGNTRNARAINHRFLLISLSLSSFVQ